LALFRRQALDRSAAARSTPTVAPVAFATLAPLGARAAFSADVGSGLAGGRGALRAEAEAEGAHVVRDEGQRREDARQGEELHAIGFLVRDCSWNQRGPTRFRGACTIAASMGGRSDGRPGVGAADMACAPRARRPAVDAALAGTREAVVAAARARAARPEARP
jgi:hypothetical protein